MSDERLETRTRDFDFTLTRSVEEGDGFTLEGTAAVFNKPARINDGNGEYDEVIAPGAFARSIRSGRKPIFMFNHGTHPVWKDMPIGVVKDWHEDAEGLQFRARLLQHDFFAPIHEAIREKAIPGMSFRFDPVKGKNDWQMRGKGQRPMCTRREINVAEFGPVITPAYVETSMALRSIISGLERSFPGVMNVQILGETRDGMMMDDDCCDPQELVQEAISSRWSLKDPLSWVEMHDNYMIFGVGDRDVSDHRGLWRVDFTLVDSVPTLSDPVQMELTPAGSAPRSLELVGETRDTTDLGTSEEPATGTSEELAEQPVRTGPLSMAERRQYIRLIELERRGITRKAPSDDKRNERSG
jgi:HK97 family phage prohead protease